MRVIIAAELIRRGWGTNIHRTPLSRVVLRDVRSQHLLVPLPLEPSCVTHSFASGPDSRDAMAVLG